MKNRNIDLHDSIILITGAVGFIGANVVEKLLLSNRRVQIIGIDNMNDYYDVNLKQEQVTQNGHL